MPVMKKMLASAAIAASVVGGGAVGAALFAPAAGIAAAETPSPGSGTAEERRTLPQAFVDALKSLVDKGTITQQQADSVAEALRAVGPQGFGPGGPGGHGFGRGVARGELLSAAADALGMEVDALREALREGKTLAEIAEDEGVERQTVVDAVAAELRSRIDQALADGRIDEEHAQEHRAEVAERAEQIVDGTLPGPGRGMRHGRGSSDGSDGAASTPTPSTSASAFAL